VVHGGSARNRCCRWPGAIVEPGGTLWNRGHGSGPLSCQEYGDIIVSS
jgi:hypothetical protein